MKKQLVALALAMSLALLAGCAKTTLVSFAPTRSDIYECKNAGKTIYVVLKTGETCEMQNFAVTADSIAGTRILRNDGDKIVERRRSKIAFNEIATIQVVESQDRSWLFFGAGTFLGVVLGAAALTGVLLALLFRAPMT